MSGRRTLRRLTRRPKRPEQTSRLVRRRLDEVDERPQRRRHQTPARVVQKRPVESLPPRFEDRLQDAALEMRAQPVLEQSDDAGAGDRRVCQEIDGPTDAHDERPGRLDLHDLAVALELPGWRRSALEPAQVAMRQQIARVLWPA